MLRTRSPVTGELPLQCPRLACVKHAASVRPEPGSNSPIVEQSDTARSNSPPLSTFKRYALTLERQAVRITMCYVSFLSPRDLIVSRIDESASHPHSHSIDFQSAFGRHVAAAAYDNMTLPEGQPQHVTANSIFGLVHIKAPPRLTTQHAESASRVREVPPSPPEVPLHDVPNWLAVREPRTLQLANAAFRPHRGPPVRRRPPNGSPSHTLPLLRTRRCSLMDSNHQPSD